MSMKKIDKKVFGEFIDNIINTDQKVYGVQAKGDRFAFAPLESAEALRLDYDVTLSSPKKYLLPDRLGERTLPEQLSFSRCQTVLL